MSGSNGSYNIWYEEQISAGKKERSNSRHMFGTQQDAFEYMTKYWDFFGKRRIIIINGRRVSLIRLQKCKSRGRERA